MINLQTTVLACTLALTACATETLTPPEPLLRFAGESGQILVGSGYGTTIITVVTDAAPATESDLITLGRILDAHGASAVARTACLGRRIEVVIADIPDTDLGRAIGGLESYDALGHVITIRQDQIGNNRVLEHELAHVAQRCLGYGAGHPEVFFGREGVLVRVFGTRHVPKTERRTF